MKKKQAELEIEEIKEKIEKNIELVVFISERLLLESKRISQKYQNESFFIEPTLVFVSMKEIFIEMLRRG